MCKGPCTNEVNQTVKARCHEMLKLIKAYTGGKIRFDGLVRGLENGINGMIDFAEAEMARRGAIHLVAARNHLRTRAG